jgi:RNA polymerase sigma-70 factor (ECF subfamily)
VTYSELNALSDELLVAQLPKQGDALAVLFRRYQRLVFSVAMKVLRDVGEAEDMTQIVFLEVYRAAPRYDAQRSSARAWIARYANHLSLNRRRYLVHRSFYSVQDVAECEELTPLLEPGGLAYPEKRRLVQQTLSGLNPAQKRVLEMVYFEGLALKEVAQRMEESIGNVRHYYYRGLTKLRDELSASRSAMPCARKEVSGAEA